jgi:cytochrome oxidase assembly protein ShyY1
VKLTSIKNITFIIVLITIVIACFSLGIWQIDRYFQKQELHDTPSVVSEVGITELINTKSNDAVIDKTVNITGSFIANSVFKLDNRMYDSTYGVEVFSLFRERTSNKVYLVNMGWLEVASDRDKLKREFDFSSIQSMHAQIANMPSKPPFVDSQNFQDEKQKDLWLFVNRQFLENQHTVSIEELVLRNMNPVDELKYRSYSKDNNAIMHILYAIQWFLFSLFALFGLIKIYK